MEFFRKSARQRLLAACLLALFVCVAAAAQSRDDRWRADLRYLAAELPRRHINLFAQMTAADFDRAVQELDQAIPSLSDAQVITGLAHIIAMAGDGHTNTILTESPTGFRRLPLSLYWFSDGLFVTRAGVEYARAAGARVVRIGETDAEKLLALVAPIISHENNYWVKALGADYLVIPEILQSVGIIPSADKAQFLLEDLAGSRFTIEFPAVAANASLQYTNAPEPAQGFVPAWRRNSNVNYWYEYWPSTRTLYFTYNSASEMANLPFQTFIAQMQKAVPFDSVDRFVLDLRNNPGGSTALLGPVLDEFKRSMPFEVRSRLYVMIGRRTYSTALIHAIDLKLSLGATLIGEPTGNKPNHYGNVASLALPNSGLSVRYSTRYFALWPTDIDALYPDVPAEMSSADYFARHDPFFAAVLAYERM